MTMIWFLPGIGSLQPVDPISMGPYLLIFGCFTSLMFVSSLKQTKILQLLFTLVSVLFFLLPIIDFTEIAMVKLIGRYLGIILGVSAVYTSIDQIINNNWEKDISKLQTILI